MYVMMLSLYMMVYKNLQSVVWKEGKRYVSQCLNVDVASFGNTKESALENLREALELYFEDEQKQVNVPKVVNPELVTI